MKILICSSYKYSAWNSVRPEAEMFIGFVVAGHQVTLCTQGDAEYVKRFKDNGVNVVDCYPTKKICLKTIKKIHRLLIENTSIWTGYIPMDFARFSKKSTDRIYTHEAL